MVRARRRRFWPRRLRALSLQSDRACAASYGRAVRALRSRETARRLRHADRAFDAERRIDTATLGPHARPRDRQPEPRRFRRVRYQPTSVEDFDLLMGKLDVEHDEFVFVDYGSGKGRVLMLAADVSVPADRRCRVLAAAWIAVARENIATLGERTPPGSRRW